MGHGGRAVEDQHPLAPQGEGGARGGARHQRQRAVQPAVARGLRIARDAGFQQVLPVEMAALVAVGGRCCGHEGQLPRLPQRGQPDKLRVQREKPVAQGRAAIRQAGAQRLERRSPIGRSASSPSSAPRRISTTSRFSPGASAMAIGVSNGLAAAEQPSAAPAPETRVGWCQSASCPLAAVELGRGQDDAHPLRARLGPARGAASCGAGHVAHGAAMTNSRGSGGLGSRSASPIAQLSARPGPAP